MREIKFRAWDGERIKEVTGVGWIDNEIDYIMTPKYSGPASDFKLMQYTGLKDKNGREIYEGDIVKYPHIVGFDDIWKVEFSNGSFVIRETIVKISLRELAHKNNLEIIGNIYESPGLLE